MSREPETLRPATTACQVVVVVARGRDDDDECGMIKTLRASATIQVALRFRCCCGDNRQNNPDHTGCSVELLQASSESISINSMKPERKQRLEAAGMKVGSAAEFLGLTPEERAMVDLRFSLAQEVRRRREKKDLSQAELARRIGSSQSRVAKIEAAEPNVSFELMFRALLATGAKKRDIGSIVAAA